jgi:predicted PurR-regulated permease PerM
VNQPAPTLRGLYGWAIALGCMALLYELRGVLTPVLVAFGLAYLLDPVVDWTERLGLPRTLGVACLLVAALLVISLGLLLLLPAIVRDLGTLAAELPAAVTRLLEAVQPWLAAHGLPVPRSSSAAISALAEHAQELVPDAVSMAQSTARALLGGTASALGVAAAAIMVPVLAFHLLRDFDRIVAAVVALLPGARRERTIAMGLEVHAVLGQFLRGQLTVMAILAVLYGGGYALVGVRLAIPIGLTAGLFSFIPYVGGALALGLGVLMTVLHWSSMGHLLAVLSVYGMVQVLEGFVITPRIVGEKLGLPAVAVLLALMIGGELFGFLGVMLALPMAAVIKVFMGHALRRYRESPLYEGRSAVAVSAALSQRPPARLRLRHARRTRLRGASQ